MVAADMNDDAKYRYGVVSKFLDDVCFDGILDMDFESMNDVKWSIRDMILVHYEYYKRTYNRMKVVKLPTCGNQICLYPKGDWEFFYNEYARDEYERQEPFFIDTNTDDFKKAFFFSYQETFIYQTMEHDIRFKVNGVDERLCEFLDY